MESHLHTQLGIQTTNWRNFNFRLYSKEKSKGCRIFIDGTDPLNSDEKVNHLFQQHIVPTNFSYIDVFEWELVNKQDNFFYPNPSDFNNCENQLTSLIVSNLQLQNFILYSPKFSWNKKSQKGREQLYASYVVLASSVKKIFANFNKQFDLASDFSSFRQFR